MRSRTCTPPKRDDASTSTHATDGLGLVPGLRMQRFDDKLSQWRRRCAVSLPMLGIIYTASQTDVRFHSSAIVLDRQGHADAPGQGEDRTHILWQNGNKW
jgi:hypothetical protein